MSAEISYPVVQTANGPVKGILEDGVYRFLGIPYAAPPTGKRRFMAPEPHEDWTETRDCFSYPDRCPVLDKWGGLYTEDSTEEERRYSEIKKVDVGNMDLRHYGTYSEDCLYLSLWTPEVGDGRKKQRPVLLWAHGGGFHSGCGDADWHDGTNMAKKHDAVLITFNHRLNVLGFCDLRAYGEQFADSANAGMLDIIAVLKWIRDNIEAFGGDPDRVLVFGESGGGMKTNVLFGMPQARGLFHSAISMSGPSRMRERKSQEASACLLQNLGITAEQIDRIFDVPTETLMEAYRKIPMPLRMELSPVIDGKNLVCDPGTTECAGVNPDVVYCIGTTHDDARLFIEDYHLCDMGWDELPSKLPLLGLSEDDAQDIIRLCLEEDDREPDAGDVFFTLRTEIQFRANARAVAQARAAAGKPVYMYLFSRMSPSKDYKAGHGSEIAFFLDNIDKAPYNTFGEGDTWSFELSEMIGSWVASLAKTGKPEADNMPEWPLYDTENRGTMVFTQDRAVVKNDPLSGYRKVYEKYCTALTWLI